MTGVGRKLWLVLYQGSAASTAVTAKKKKKKIQGTGVVGRIPLLHSAH